MLTLVWRPTLAPRIAQGATSVREIVMLLGLGIIGFVLWILIAFWPARVAARKGHSFLGYFLLSVLFFPLALIMAYVVPDRSRAAYDSYG